MESLKIRPFLESDQAAVIDLWLVAFGYAAAHNDPLSVIRHKLLVQRKLFWVALREDRVVGTIMAGYDGHRGWLYSLAVASNLRRRGIGTALMQYAEQELARRGCPKVNLQVVASNAAVVAMYQKLGYAIEDRISLGKALPPAS